MMVVGAHHYRPGHQPVRRGVAGLAAVTLPQRQPCGDLLDRALFLSLARPSPQNRRSDHNFTKC
ncbi:hypothetical protein J4732_22060 [Serratia marcescens]|uniref:Uncharacterized protein n=1 Tax=Serratia marcescens TaxID=615 RepID=A0A939NPS7_SERMA|nr:hypothetical protein [Serratia marcescens]